MVLCCFIFSHIVFLVISFPLAYFLCSSNPLSEPKSVAARKRNSRALAKATQPVCSSCHHQQQLPPSADAKRHESSSRDHFCSQQRKARCLLKNYVRAGGGKVTKPTGGSLNEWKRSQKDLESSLRVSVFGK